MIAPLALAASIVAAPTGVDAQALKQTLTHYQAALVPLSLLTGGDVVDDYAERLIEDAGDLGVTQSTLPTYSPNDYHAYAEHIATLDNDLALQLLAGKPRPMDAIRGLGETLVKSSVDGTLQAVAIYVPTGYDPTRAAPLVVFLHGHPQSESALLAKPELERLADATGSILVAPYGRGYYDFRGAAGSDVYDAYDAAIAAFKIDPQRRYLAGYSMGGFSVFEVAPKKARAWTALMCVSGGLFSDADAALAARSLHVLPLYVITGENDGEIPTEFTTETAEFLRFTGEPVSYYQQPTGTHNIETLEASLTIAWTDMHRGTVREPPPGFSDRAAPPAPMKSLEP